MNCFPLLRLLLLLLLLPLSLLPHHRATATPALTDRFELRGPTRRSSPQPQEYLDPTLPPLHLPAGPPACSLPVLRHDFAHTFGSPPASAPYAPPSGCPAPWSRVVLDLTVSCAGEQYDRIAAVWLDGAEILRTSTAEPTELGVFWRVRKDVTHYSPLLRRASGGAVSVMLENIVNSVYTGVYHVNVSLDFFLEDEEQGTGGLGLGFRSHEPGRRMIKEGRNGDPGLGFSLQDSADQFTVETESAASYAKPVIPVLRFKEKLGFSSVAAGNPTRSSKLRSSPLYHEPADLILPISSENPDTGYWFRFKNQSDVLSKSVEIPVNTHRAVLELYASSHSDDEFWYSNPPTSYIKDNNLTTGRGNGAFRELFATIDGRFVGSVVPLPVIFTGGINPLFWSPVVAIGAFNLPSYNLDLTPFLGLLLDGKPHDFGLGVTDGIAFWLVDANLHLWLDPHAASVNAELIQYKAPVVSVSCINKASHLNGTFNIEAGRKFHFSGWVNSSLGNLTTDVDQKLKFKSSIQFLSDGNYKEVHMKAKKKTDIRIKEGPKTVLARMSHKAKYPLLIVTSALPGDNNTYTSRTNLSHTLYEETSHVLGKVVTTSAIVDRQVAVGQMLVQDHSVLDGSASTQQTYQYRDNSGCYLRRVSAKDGNILYDNSTNLCALAS